MENLVLTFIGHESRRGGINKHKELTNLSSASIFRYLWMNDIMELIGLLPSTAHLRFFIIGTFPVAFRSMSTVLLWWKHENKEVKFSFIDNCGEIVWSFTFRRRWLFVRCGVNWSVSFDWHFLFIVSRIVHFCCCGFLHWKLFKSEKNIFFHRTYMYALVWTLLVFWLSNVKLDKIKEQRARNVQTSQR